MARLDDVARWLVTSTPIVATFVLSLLSGRPTVLGDGRRLVGGPAVDGSPWPTWAGRPPPRPVVRPLLGALTAFGGGDPDRRPWDRLLARCADGVHEQHLGGHVHLAAGTADAARLM